MTSLVLRRWFNTTLLLIAGVAVVWAYLAYAPSVRRLPYVSGWVLLVLMLVLTAYNGRKKLPFLPLLSSRAWLQFHIYTGLATAVLFLAHISFRVPSGWFEVTLAWLYFVVMASGIFGLALSRLMPKRLTTRGGEVLYERIPAIRRTLQQSAETIALKSIPEAQTSTIADFYVRELKHFFDGPRNFWLHLLEVRRPLNTLLDKITDLNRYSNDKEREKLNQLADMVRQKDGLDYHHAIQTLLKAWLFVHIPFTYSLLIFSFVHVVLVFAFSGGAR